MASDRNGSGWLIVRSPFGGVLNLRRAETGYRHLVPPNLLAGAGEVIEGLPHAFAVVRRRGYLVAAGGVQPSGVRDGNAEP